MSSTALPEFRRATAEDAFEVARLQFAAGDRVDMQALAERLGIGRTTLYRWVGDKERFLGRLVVDRVGEAWRTARGRARGRGESKTLSSVREFIALVIADDALRSFVQREPTLALRVMMEPDGLVARALTAGLEEAMLTDTGSASAATTYPVFAQVATALVWSNVAAGLEPDLEAIIGVLRAVLRSTQP